MKQFLRNILIFSSIILLLLAAGEVVSRKLPSVYRYKAEYMRRFGDKVEVIILGNSHTYYGIQPDKLGVEAFNLANITQTPEYDLAILQEYIDSSPKLKYVIIPISYCTYRDPSFKDSDIWYFEVKYKVDMRLSVHPDLSIYNLSIVDFDAYSGKLGNIVRRRKSNICDSLGYGLNYSLADRETSLWESKGIWHARQHYNPYCGRDSVVFRLQSEMIELCRSHGAEPVFITTPGWKTYREHLDRQQLDEMYRRAYELRDRYNVKYYDFLADQRFIDADFHDVDHMSEFGAAKLTRILADTLNLTSSAPLASD